MWSLGGSSAVKALTLSKNRLRPAIRTTDGSVFDGDSHMDACVWAVEKRYGLTREEMSADEIVDPLLERVFIDGEDGYVTSDGTFLTRVEVQKLFGMSESQQLQEADAEPVNQIDNAPITHKRK